MRLRRHLPSGGFGGFRLPEGALKGIRLPRSAWLWVVGSIVAGYLVAFLAVSPAPLMAGDHAVPRVLDLSETEATSLLRESGLRGRVRESQPHPSAAPGTVIWQDPPPGVALPEGALVHLTLSSGQPDFPIPDVVGLDAGIAAEILRAAGFTIGSIDSIAALSDLGTIVVTRPAAGVARAPGTTIALLVSQGPAVIPIPSVVGLTHAEAWDRLDQAGLRVGRVMTRPRDDVPAGTVVDQRPAAGTRSPMGGKVDLTFARRPQ